MAKIVRPESGQVDPNSRSIRQTGIGAIACYAAHAAYLGATGLWPHALWSCHVGCLVAGVGLLAGRARWNATGFLLLAMGLPMWLASLAAGGEFVPTSPLTHLGGLAISAWGVRCLGAPRGSWIGATAVLAALHLLARLVTPPEANVNLSDRGWFGFEDRLLPRPVNLVLTLVVAAALFAAVENLARRVGRRA